MLQLTTVQIPVEQTTADALADDRRRAAIGRLVDRVIQRGEGEPLLRALESTAAEAKLSGLTDADIDEELGRYKVDRPR